MGEASGIRCGHPKCLASIMWVGSPLDRALANLAKSRGWVLFEGQGWTCPTHSAPAAALRALAQKGGA